MGSKQKKYASILLKISLLCLVLWGVHYKIQHQEGLREFRQLMRSLNRNEWMGCLLGLCVLMGINWSLEGVKWRFLCRPIQVLSFSQALEAVFCGLSWAVFTPNRIGEYGGRVLFLKPRKRVFGMVAMGVGAFAQLVITNVMGAIALIWFLGSYFSLSLGLYVLIVLILGGLILVMGMLYFNIHWVNRRLQRITWLSRVHRFFSLLERYDRKSLKTVFFISLCRFVVFTSQYLLVMNLLIPTIPLLSATLLIFLLFFIQSALPSLDLLDVGVRSLTASYLFAFITKQELAVMASAAAIWFINLIVPAIIGAAFVFKINFFGTSDR